MTFDAIAPFFDRPASPFHSCGPRDRVLLLGLGNVLLTDEGIGVHAVTALKKQFSFFPAIDIVDGGTMGLDLLPLFQDRYRILIVDAVDFGRPAGHIAALDGAAVPSILNTKLSAHHIGLADLLVAARFTRDSPLDVCLVGIQPHSLDMGIGLSPRLGCCWKAVLSAVLNRLGEWDIEARLRA